MSPISLNPIGPSMQGQNQFFNNNIYSNNNHNYDSSSSSTSLLCRNLFINILEVGDFRVKDQQDDKQVVFHDESLPSNNQDYCNSSFKSNISPHDEQVTMEDQINTTSEDHNLLPFIKKPEEKDKNNKKDDNSKNNNHHYYEGHGSAKWMPSKMRLMKKMMMRHSSRNNEDKLLINTTQSSSIRFQNHHNGTIRVCSDCNTSTTPLWRSGPNGPKSLCNACGIRQRKARRALMAAEATNNGFATSIDNNAKTRHYHHHHNNKEKKTRTNHFTQFKNNNFKSTTTTSSSSSHHQGETKKLVQNRNDEEFAINSRKDLAFHHHQHAIPRDEVAHAALLLMDLSCGGFVHS